MKKTLTLFCSLVLVLVGLTSTGCRSSLSVPFLDLKLGTAGHKHSHESKTDRLEDRIDELEEENHELRERLDELEEVPE